MGFVAVIGIDPRYAVAHGRSAGGLANRLTLVAIGSAGTPSDCTDMRRCRSFL